MFANLFKFKHYIIRAHDIGLMTGFKLGQLYEQSKQKGSGAILSARVKQDINEIMEREKL